MIAVKNKNLLYQFLFGLIIFLVPSNLFFKILESSAYVNGLLIDYLIPKLYLSDLVIFALFSWWVVDHQKTILKKIQKTIKKVVSLSKKNKLIFFLVLALILRQFNTSHPLAAYLYLFKIFELTILGLILINKKKLLTPIFILASTIPTLLFQSSVAITQFFNQTSIASYLFLGEANLSKQIGLAKQTINGIEKILPYGTTAHPNILGGILAFYLIFLIGALLKPSLRRKKYHQQPFVLSTIFIAILALSLTFSLSAWLTFLTGMILITNNIWKNSQFNNKKLLLWSIRFILLTPLILHLGSNFSLNPSIKRRAYLNRAAINMLQANPIWGVGFNNFTTQVEKYSPTREVVRFTQPSHHTLLLILSEVGLLGLAIIVLLGQKNLFTKKGKKILQKNLTWGSYLLVMITPLITLDHYLLTNQSGLLLIVITVVLTKNFLFPLQK